MAGQNEVDKITTTMMEHLCDHLCRFPWETERKEDLEDICAECKMGQYVCDILNTYKLDRQEWIPVTERLPELDTDVLVAVYDFGEDTSTLLDCLVESNGKPMWSTFNGATEQVLAWKPLPEPYRLSNKGDDE